MPKRGGRKNSSKRGTQARQGNAAEVEASIKTPPSAKVGGPEKAAESPNQDCYHESGNPGCDRLIVHVKTKNDEESLDSYERFAVPIQILSGSFQAVGCGWDPEHEAKTLHIPGWPFINIIIIRRQDIGDFLDDSMKPDSNCGTHKKSGEEWKDVTPMSKYPPPTLDQFRSSVVMHAHDTDKCLDCPGSHVMGFYWYLWVVLDQDDVKFPERRARYGDLLSEIGFSSNSVKRIKDELPADFNKRPTWDQFGILCGYCWRRAREVDDECISDFLTELYKLLIRCLQMKQVGIEVLPYTGTASGGQS